MRRSLHVKLTLIMMLLILSLMTVVGSFLINSVMGFYIDDFYSQIATAFGQENVDFVRALQTPTEGETDGAAMIDQVLEAYSGSLGVDSRNRNYYVLDGVTAAYLAGSLPQAPEHGVVITPNIEAALLGETGDQSDSTADYMDAAIPITRGEARYIVYILDNRQTVRSLTADLFTLIGEALVLGLVISLLLSTLQSKTLTTPIERLTDGLKEVADGNFSKKIEVTSRDEIGLLTESFNTMAQQLQDTIAAVENERNKLDTLFLHMADGVVAFDRSGCVIHFNPAAQELLSRTIHMGDRYNQLFGDLFTLSEAAAVDGYLSAERTVGNRTLDLRLAPYDRANQGGVLVLIHDVTEQRKAEEMRKDFVANVSHELRTPLTNIRSYAETLVDGAADMPPEMTQNFLSVILGESDRMTHIVQDLLTLSRFDSGKSGLNLTRFPFGQAIRDTYQAVLLDAQKHDHTISLRLPPALPEILADRERIVQVMMNIVSNSIKYTPNGGAIMISAGASGKWVWMEVDDNGIGIPQEDRGRIFERFYRVDKARSRQSGGTGLGLSIAKEIVDSHQGRLFLVDKDAPGLTIRLELQVDGPQEDHRHDG